MRTTIIASLLSAAAALAACGPTDETQAATGALGGAAVGGPVGAGIGGAAGAAID